MLDRLRQGAQGWVSKLLMLLLVLSFGIWGVSGQLSGYGAGTVATVGDQEITVPEFARAQERLQRAGQQAAPEQVLNQLIMTAALDDAAQSVNLGVSDDTVAKRIAADPTFQGQGGSFDRDRFTALLQNAGMDTNDYVLDVRQQTIRGQIASSVGAGVGVPQPLVEALYRFQNEERALSYVVVDQAAIEPVGQPDDAALQGFFEANQERFRAPEYRRLAFVTLDPAALAKPETVTEEEIAAEYQRRLPTLTRPERRRIEQVRFESREAAEQALASLAGGSDLGPVAQSRGLALADLDQGLKTQAEFLDPAVAQTAFAAQPNVVVPVLEGAIEPSLIKVTAVEPGSVTPLAEIAPRLRDEIAGRKARDAVQNVYDEVEDQRAGGAPLQEIAAATSLPFREVPAVAADGTAPDGTQVPDLPARDQLLTGAFESDVGVENNPVRFGDSGFVFYDVVEIIPARDRTLDEVRPAVVSAWQAEETANRVNQRADGALKRLQAGEPIQAIAAELNKPVQIAENIRRGGPAPGLSANAVAQAFAGPEGHVANAEADQPPARILLRVDRVTAPAYFAEAADAQAIRTQLSAALSNDLMQSFNRDILQGRETTINQAVFSQITGTPNPQ